jgi:prepilin-type N-terminal cleavage/methylation domain-containing protein
LGNGIENLLKTYRFCSNGFTLLELLVVFVLATLLISIAFPRFRDSLITDPLTASVRRLSVVLKEVRSEAFHAQEVCRLHLDLENNRYWIESGAMTEEELSRARKHALWLPDGVRIQDVWIKGAGKKWDSETVIVFNSKGYSQPALIHVWYPDGREYTLELSPFLGSVMIHEGRVEIEANT